MIECTLHHVPLIEYSNNFERKEVSRTLRKEVTGDGFHRPTLMTEFSWRRKAQPRRPIDGSTGTYHCNSKTGYRVRSSMD